MVSRVFWVKTLMVSIGVSGESLTKPVINWAEIKEKKIRKDIRYFIKK
jgi:hypothetical protein